MAFVAPDIDNDALAALLANPVRAAAMKAAANAPVPPGVNPALIQPQPPMVPATALNKGAMSAGTSGLLLPNTPPPAPSIPAPSPIPPSLTNPLTDKTNAILAQRPQATSVSADPYAPKIAALHQQISDAKPKWWERALGGLDAAAVAYGTKNPALGVEIGSHITNRQREGLEGQLQPLEQQEQAYQSQNQRDFENKRQSWEDALKSVAEQRSQQSADALNQERTQRGNQYESMTPQQRTTQVPQLEGMLGIQMTPEEKMNFIAGGKMLAREAKPSLSDLISQRDQEGRAAGLTGDSLMYYKLNGKLKEQNPEDQERLEEARERLAEQKARREEAEARAGQAEDDRFQNRVQTYRNRKANIVQREKQAFNDLEKESRDNKTGQIKDPASLESRKKTLEGQYNDEFNALGPEPTRGQPAPQTATPPAKPSKTADLGPAPAGSREGRTGKLQDGTLVVVKNGRLVKQ